MAHMAHVIERVHVHMPLASLWGWNPSIEQIGLHRWRKLPATIIGSIPIAFIGRYSERALLPYEVLDTIRIKGTHSVLDAFSCPGLTEKLTLRPLLDIR